MNKRGFIFFTVFTAFFLLRSCTEEPPGEKPVMVDDQQLKWTDSVFGMLTEKQRYYQHLVIEIPAAYQGAADSLVSWVASCQPGALKFNGWNPDSVQLLKQALDTLPIIQPFLYGDYFSLLGSVPYPFWEVNDVSMDADYMSVFSKAGYHLLHFDEPVRPTEKNLRWLDSIREKQGIHAIIADFDDRNAADQFDAFISTLRHTDQAVGINLQLFDTVKLDIYRKANDYNGLFVVRTRENRINQLIGSGADFVFRSIESAESFNNWSPAEMEREAAEASVLRILRAKHNRLNNTAVNVSEELNFVKLRMQYNATALLNNKGRLIPFSDKFTLFAAKEIRLPQKIRTENKVSVVRKELTIENVKDIIRSKGNKMLLLEDTCSAEILETLAEVDKSDKLLVGFTNPDHYRFLRDCPVLLFYPGAREFDYGILVQQLTSRLSLSAGFFVNDSLVKGLSVSKKLLARTDPNFCGLDADTLRNIQWLMNNSMNNRAFPGAQVLIAKNGCIIYDRCFGNLSYTGGQPVNENTLYDLASITKVVATTLVGMKLYEMKAFDLDDSLVDYLPDSLSKCLPYPSTIRYLTFRQLFIHQSGMPAGFPVLRYMKYTSPEIGRFDKYYCDKADSCFDVEICENYYMEREYQDSMWLRLNQIFLNPDKSYHYSDVNMNTLYFMFKSIIRNDPGRFGINLPPKQLRDKDLFVELLYTAFYKPLGMDHTCYRPLTRFEADNIAPTEHDTFWRKQLLKGYVHDPNAALHGGVAGNAGIFSTAGDLAILCQMWLNKGVYNGQRYLSEETVERFTARQENSHRGLGFNKPTLSSTSFGMSENASMSTYGHTGFTGTCMWVDPEHELIYIYLSNAVHPSVNNKNNELGIRKKVHQVAYDAMMLKDF